MGEISPAEANAANRLLGREEKRRRMIFRAWKLKADVEGLTEK
jgi:hypothetical protein